MALRHPRTHATPFQRNISVRSISESVRQPATQTSPAAQALPPGPALTPFRAAFRPGLGLATRDHLVPSQRKISVR